MCFIYSNKRSTLDYNTFTEGRYYYTVISIRQEIDYLLTKKARNKYTTIQGIDLSPIAIILYQELLPILDIVITRPRDPVYSEFQGLVGILYSLLLKGILTLSVAKEYATFLYIVLFPTDQPQV